MDLDRANILIVDDETPVLHVLGTKLRAHGYEVNAARDGRAGLDAALLHQPDLIITDHSMPRLNGLEMIDRLVEDYPPHRELPAVLLLTSRSISPDPERPGTAHISAVMLKPFSPRDLLGQIELALALRGEQTAELADPLTGSFIDTAIGHAPDDDGHDLRVDALASAPRNRNRDADAAAPRRSDAA